MQHVSELGALINRYQDASSTVMRRVHNEIRSSLRDDLTVEQYGILRYVREREYATSTELADIFLVGKSAITSIITKLVDKALLSRQPDPVDRRIIRLAITEEGKALSQNTDRWVEEWLAKYLVHFTQGEVEMFITSFEKLAKLVSK